MIGHDKNGAVNPFNPFFNMWVSITRRTREGEVIFAQEKITRQEALKMWTIWAAYLQFGETARGSIEPGKFAESWSSTATFSVARKTISAASSRWRPS